MPKLSKKNKVPDKNLALIAIILGATSFAMSVFTGVPAITVGLIALRKKSGNRLQAKLAILFGILSTALWALVIWLVGFLFFNAPLSQQYSTPREDFKRITATINSLNDFRKDHGNFPSCEEAETNETCSDWRRFTIEHPNIIKNHILFINNATSVQSQPNGTVVYVRKATCFFNTPTLPAYLRNNNDIGSGPSDNTVALVYFHSKGRACYSTDQRYYD